MIRSGSLAFVLVLAVLLAVAPVDAARTTTHSGRIAAIDPQGGVPIIEEVGPWRVIQGRTVVTRRIVTITPATKFNTFIRVNVPGAF